MTALSAIYFYACALLSVVGALGVVIAKNPIRGAMGLLLLILSIAGLFLALHAQFLAAVQLLVYPGAVRGPFLFLLMLLRPSAPAPRHPPGGVARPFGGGRLPPRHRGAGPGAAGTFSRLCRRLQGELRMIPAEHYVLLSALLFVIGGVGFLVRRNVLVTLMSIEVMLNATNLALVAFNRSRLAPGVTQTYPAQSHTGQVFAFFVIAAEAAEVAVGLSIVLALHPLRRTVRSEQR